jgi:hypothetical protein
VRPHTAVREKFVDTAVETCILCGAGLSQDAKFCSQCGQGVTNEASNSQPQQSSSRQAIGPTRFFFRRTTAEIVVKAAVTNEAAQVFAEVIQTLATDKLLRTPRMSDFAAEEDQDLDPVETTAEIHPGIEAPSVPAQQSAPAETGRGIERIFRIHNGAPRLEHHILKAKDPTEYARRLIRLFVHYMVHHGGAEEVGRNDLYRFLDAVGISGNIYRPLVSRDQSLSRKKDSSKKGNDAFCLNVAGEQQVRRYLEEIANPEIEDGWWPGKDDRPAAPRKRRTSKRTSDPKEAEVPVAEAWSEEVQQLRELVKARHEEISNWQPIDLGLLGLYAIRKMQGDDKDASYIKVKDILYSALELSVPERRLRSTLEATRKSRDSYVNPGSKGRGFRISPTGVRRVEDLLSLKQLALVATSTDESPNGVSES